MKINISLFCARYPVATIGFEDAIYDKDFSLENNGSFNIEIPNDILQKWVKSFLDFEQTQKEMFEYSKQDKGLYLPNYCEFVSLNDIK